MAWFSVMAISCLALQAWSLRVRTTKPADVTGPKVYAVTKLRSIPHEGEPFTQGLEMSFDNSLLVETSGSFPPGTRSFVRWVDPATGNTTRMSREGLGDPAVFIEGIVKHGSHWIASTFESKQCLEYDADLKLVKTHQYPFEGWGLTGAHDGKSFLATNGTTQLMSLEADTFKPLGSKPVTCFGSPVPGLNELEFVPDFAGNGPTVLGNIYQTRLVLAFDPESAVCTGIFHLMGLGNLQPENESNGLHVANGIAYNASSGNFWVTGKNWKEMFEVSITASSDQQPVKLLKEFLQL